MQKTVGMQKERLAQELSKGYKYLDLHKTENVKIRRGSILKI